MTTATTMRHAYAPLASYAVLLLCLLLLLLEGASALRYVKAEVDGSNQGAAALTHPPHPPGKTDGRARRPQQHPSSRPAWAAAGRVPHLPPT